MALPPGSQLGPYTIASPLGAGGMGEVYRARDSRLGRDVAIKVLPSSSSADGDRLQRFEQEARAAAALNHPNILALYDIGRSESGPYLVTELLEGETLRAVLERGAMPIRKAVELAVQIRRSCRHRRSRLCPRCNASSAGVSRRIRRRVSSQPVISRLRSIRCRERARAG